MGFPDFFAKAPTITLGDPLAAFLGASEGGLITYTYADAVKLAGHSCPTVAGAFLMLRRGLAHLFGGGMPERGGIEVHLRERREQGTTGVTAAVATLITGAASETGFGGIGAGQRFSRRGLLHFEAPIEGQLALRRRDNGHGVVLDLDLARVPHAPEMQGLFARAVTGEAGQEEQARFAALWQGRVARMLLEHADDPRLVTACEWETAA